jgi:hypothetical protein
MEKSLRRLIYKVGTLKGKVTAYAKWSSTGNALGWSRNVSFKQDTTKLISKVNYAHEKFKKQWNRQFLSFLKIIFFL